MIVLAIDPVPAMLCVTRQPVECRSCPHPEDGLPYKRLISLSARDARRVEVGARVAIAATREKPEESEWTLPYPPWTMWLDEFGVRVLQHYTFADANTIATYKSWPLPLGAIVGSATVEAVVPIVEDQEDVGDVYWGPACIESRPDHGYVRLWPEWSGALEWEAGTDISDQLVYDTGLTPGRWAVLLTDAAPSSERCVACWWRWPDHSDHCADPWFEPIPYTATGRVGRWELRHETGWKFVPDPTPEIPDNIIRGEE